MIDIFIYMMCVFVGYTLGQYVAWKQIGNDLEKIVENEINKQIVERLRK